MLCAHCNIGLHLYLCFNMLYACLLIFFCMTVNVVAKQLIKLLYTLCSTATESCHKLWSCSHFSDATYEFGFTCLGLCVCSACVSVCACVWKCIYDTWTLLGYCKCEWTQHLSLFWNGGHEQSDNSAVLSNTHEQYTVYVQTGCEGKIINISSYTMKCGSTTDILWEPWFLNGYIWLL